MKIDCCEKNEAIFFKFYILFLNFEGIETKQIDTNEISRFSVSVFYNRQGHFVQVPKHNTGPVKIHINGYVFRKRYQTSKAIYWSCRSPSCVFQTDFSGDFNWHQFIDEYFRHFRCHASARSKQGDNGFKHIWLMNGDHNHLAYEN